MNSHAWFWSFVAAFGAAGVDEDRFATRVARLSEAELVTLERHTRELSRDLGVAPIYGALRLMSGGSLSDDRFEYLRYWIVFQGESFFNEVIANPDVLAERLSPPCDDHVNEWWGSGENLGYVVASEWERRGLDEDDLEERVGIGRGEDTGDWEWRDGLTFSFPRIQARCR
jgi:hypothetical protein